jgi:hypothetical protein
MAKRRRMTDETVATLERELSGGALLARELQSERKANRNLKVERELILRKSRRRRDEREALARQISEIREWLKRAGVPNEGSCVDMVAKLAEKETLFRGSVERMKQVGLFALRDPSPPKSSRAFHGLSYHVPGEKDFPLGDCRVGDYLLDTLRQKLVQLAPGGPLRLAGKWGLPVLYEGQSIPTQVGLDWLERSPWQLEDRAWFNTGDVWGRWVTIQSVLWTRELGWHFGVKDAAGHSFVAVGSVLLREMP